MRRSNLWILSLLVAVPPAVAQTATTPAFYSGGSLVNALRSQGPDRREAEGYLLGVFDLSAHDRSICPGPNVTSQQVVALVRNQLIDSPQYWDAPAAQVVSALLFKTWRCKGGG